MAYQDGQTYKIVLNSAQSLALNMAGVASGPYNNRNVNVYIYDGTTDMKWVVSLYTGFARIKSAANTAYALDYYYGSSNPGNCDVYTWSNNLEDSKIDFRTIDATNNVYRIQCYRNNANNNLYLTADSASNGANVSWQPLNTSNPNQIWKLVQLNTSKQLRMPDIANQNAYAYNQNGNTTMQRRGDSLCCGLVCSQYYGASANNTIAYFLKNYWNNTSGYTWQSPKAAFSSVTANLLQTIKSEIDANRPVVVLAKQGTQEKWVVAYKYLRSAATWNDIYALDSENFDKNSLIGHSNQTIYSIMNQSFSSTYKFEKILTTRAR